MLPLSPSASVLLPSSRAPLSRRPPPSLPRPPLPPSQPPPRFSSFSASFLAASAPLYTLRLRCPLLTTSCGAAWVPLLPSPSRRAPSHPALPFPRPRLMPAPSADGSLSSSRSAARLPRPAAPLAELAPPATFGSTRRAAPHLACSRLCGAWRRAAAAADG